MCDPLLILLLHGSIVLVVGLLAGIPYGLAMGRGSGSRERAWRVAHSGLTMGGTTLIAVCAVLGTVDLGTHIEALIAYSLVASGYGFLASLPYAAWGDHTSAFWPAGTVSSWIISVGNIVGAGGSLLGAATLTYGAALLLL